MKLNDLRDEAAQEAADKGSDFLYALEESWQEVHAAELPYERLHEDYYTGLSEMVLRVANCWLDEIRERCAYQPGLSEDARAIQRMKVRLP